MELGRECVGKPGQAIAHDVDSMEIEEGERSEEIYSRGGKGGEGGGGGGGGESTKAYRRGHEKEMRKGYVSPCNMPCLVSSRSLLSPS